MKNGLRRLVLLFLAVFMLLCSAQALAESITKVPADRIAEVILPEGIVTIGKPIIEDGKVTVKVDDNKTNWTEVLLKAASRDILDICLSIRFPDEMSAITWENFGSDDSETLDPIAKGEAPSWFVEYGLNNYEGTSITTSNVYAVINCGQRQRVYVNFADVTNSGTVIGWEDKSGQRHYEYVQWEIIRSGAGESDPLEVERPALSEEWLSSVADALPNGVTAETEPGGVTCIVQDFSALNNMLTVTDTDTEKETHLGLPIMIDAPANATTAVIYSANGRENVKIENGRIKLSITPDSHSTFFDNKIQPAQLDYTIGFKDANGNVIDYGALTVWLLAKEKTPYPYYNPGEAKPVANERLTIWQGDQIISNSAIYRKEYGQAHLSEASLNFSDNPSGNIRIDITVPEGAVKYSVDASGGDFIYQTMWMLDVGWGEMEPVAGAASVSIYDQPLFKTVHAGRALVYLPEGIFARYGGYVYGISWYNESEEEPFLIEYISVTHDEFGEVVCNTVKQDEAQINKPVDEVTAVSQNDWQLVVRHDPQNGERAIHYDLTMADKHGVTSALKDDTVFYIPYPEGYSYEDTDIVYQLYHYDDAYRSYVLVELEPTPNGLRFVEDHLSPFVLMWDEAEPVIDLPKTGDNSHLEWLMAAMVVSIVVLAHMMRRKRCA